MSTELPQGAVAVWPGGPGYKAYQYRQLPPERAWRSDTDETGHTFNYKVTSDQQDVAVRYMPQLPGPGKYVVEVYVPRRNAKARRVGYHVLYYIDGIQREKVTRVNQAASAGRWVPLGTFDLSPNQKGSGRVNVTDFSTEEAAPIAFAGIRWVPAHIHAQLNTQPSGGSATATRPAPQPTGPTNQDVINAFIVAAADFGEKFTDWTTAASINHIYQNRKAPFDRDIGKLGGISPDRLEKVRAALTLPSAELAQTASSASKRRPKRGKGQVDGRTWGVHGSAGFGVPPRQHWDFWLRELTEMGIEWYKQCDNGGDDTGPNSNFQWVHALKNAGIEPVIRYQQQEQYPNGMARNYYDKMAKFASIGVVYAEIGNEPNLPWEWSGNFRPQLKYHNPEAVRIINQQWVENAEEALRRGVRPAYPAFAPTDWRGGFHPDLSSVKFYEAGFNYLARNFKQRVQSLFRNGAWLAVHVSTYEQPPDFDPFAHNPVWDMCLRGYEVPLKYMEDFLDLDVNNLVVMSTEGGVFTPESTSMNNRPRLKNEQEHAQKTLEMFDYIETDTPLAAMMPWCIAVDERIGHKPEEYVTDGWYLDRGGFHARSVVATLKQEHARR